MNHAYLITGCNMGDRHEQLAVAARLLEERCGPIIDRSAVYETEPWGIHEQASFLNQVLLIATELTARETIDRIGAIEAQMGRERKEKNGPRIIDIDILFFNHQVIREPGLVVPHPRMTERRFVLEPLNEIAPAYIHPVLYKTVQKLLSECADEGKVKKQEA